MNEAELKSLEGLTVEEAGRRVDARGLHCRILSQDGTSFPAITNYDMDRVNFHVVAGKVVSASIG
jgi:hypothetical protein